MNEVRVPREALDDLFRELQAAAVALDVSSALTRQYLLSALDQAIALVSKAAPAPAAAGASETPKRINVYSVSDGFTQREPWPRAPTQRPPVDLRVAAEGVIYRAEECGMFRTHVMTDFQASLHILRAALSAGAGAPAEGEGGAG